MQENIRQFAIDFEQSTNQILGGRTEIAVIKFGVASISQASLDRLHAALKPATRGKDHCDVLFEVKLDDGAVARIKPKPEFLVIPEDVAVLQAIIPDALVEIRPC